MSDFSNLDNLKTMLREVERKTGYKPIIYIPYFLYKRLAADPTLRTYPVGIARYGRRLDESLKKQIDWTFWQLSNHYKVHGIQEEVDADTFNGTNTDLQRLLMK